MGRKLFVTDIHGCFSELIALFDAAKFAPGEDFLVVGGDMVDRGPSSALVLKTLKALQDKHPARVKAIIGNHEEMMGWFFSGKHPMWLLHGGEEALDSFSKEFSSERILEAHVRWAVNLPLFWEDEEFFYAHAGFDPAYSLFKQSRDVLWMPKKEFYLFGSTIVNERAGGKIVVHGHTPEREIRFDGARLSCDLGAASSEHQTLALVDLTNWMRYAYDFQTKTVSEAPLPPRKK